MDPKTWHMQRPFARNFQHKKEADLGEVLLEVERVV
jgi:hypothetical protein